MGVATEGYGGCRYPQNLWWGASGQLHLQNLRKLSPQEKRIVTQMVKKWGISLVVRQVITFLWKFVCFVKEEIFCGHRPLANKMCSPPLDFKLWRSHWTGGPTMLTWLTKLPILHQKGKRNVLRMSMSSSRRRAPSNYSHGYNLI